jgi:hypothetical protein
METPNPVVAFHKTLPCAMAELSKKPTKVAQAFASSAVHGRTTNC